jgi:hypothetical protein
VDVFHRGGRIGGYLERAGRNAAYYWAVVEPVQGSFNDDADDELGRRAERIAEIVPLQRVDAAGRELRRGGGRLHLDLDRARGPGERTLYLTASARRN